MKMYDAIMKSAAGRKLVATHNAERSKARAEARAQAESIQKEVDLRKGQLLNLIEGRFTGTDKALVLYWSRRSASTAEVISVGGEDFETLASIVRDHTQFTNAEAKLALGVTVAGFVPKS